MSTPHWFLGKGQGPLRDGRPSFEEELAKMPPMADSCYRRLDDWAHSTCGSAVARLQRALTDTAPRSPEPDEPSPD